MLVPREASARTTRLRKARKDPRFHVVSNQAENGFFLECVAAIRVAKFAAVREDAMTNMRHPADR
jgi:hypothetical protein